MIYDDQNRVIESSMTADERAGRNLNEATMRGLTRLSPEYLETAADALGYERIEWDAEDNCWVGYGSSNPTDRSRDDVGALFVACNDAELRQRVDN